MQTLGGYELTGELARGGMGVVYRGRNPRTGREVAIKVVLAGEGAGEAQLRRFQRESQALSRIRHPNILAVHTAGLERRIPYLVTDLISGGTLQERLNRGGSLDPEQAVRIVSALARGLAVVHAEGLLHRDLKPDNVLLDADGIPRLADFGLVSELDPAQSRLTKTGALLGTPHYMSPEQARGQRQALGPASDIYGLGAVLYAALTGSPPARGGTLIEVLESVIHEAPTPPSRTALGIPRALELLCLRCLAKDPLQRPTSMEELAEALETVLDLPPTRSRARIAAAGLSLLAFAGLFAALSWTFLGAGAPKVSHTPSPTPPRAQASPSPRESLGEEELLRGNALRSAGRYPEAIEAYNRSLALQPDLTDALIFRSWTQVQTRDYQGAIEGYTQALSLLPAGHPYLSSAYSNRALARMRSQDLVGALPDLDAALKLKVTSLGHYNRGLARGDTGDSEGALEDFAQALALDPKDEAGARLARAKLYLRSGRYSEAVEDISALLERHPEDASLWVLRGRTQGALGNLPLAQADFDQALLKDPQHVEALVNRGRTHTMQGDTLSAEADFDAALRLAPKQAEVLNARGSHFSLQGQFAQAEREYDALVQATPLDSDAWLCRGQVRVQLRDYKGAGEDFEQALSLQPRNGLALGNRGALKAKLGDASGARRDLEEALRCLPQTQAAARQAFERILQGL